MQERKYEKPDKPRPVELTEKVKENLRRMAEWRREWSKFITLQPGDEFCKLFDPRKMIPVERCLTEKIVTNKQGNSILIIAF